jgi:parallel beta-helix repeat protein
MCHSDKKTFITLLCITFFIWPWTYVKAKSLYAVQHNEYLSAFNISGNELLFGAQIRVPHHGLGPIDVEVDDEAGIIFISYEAIPPEEPGNVIEIYNTSLCHIGTAVLSGPGDIAGLVFDKANSRLIAAERNRRKIWLIDWNPGTLQLDTTPSSVNLEGMRYAAAGLALNGSTLYVSDFYYTEPPYFTKSVHLYDMSDSFDLIETVNMGNKVVGITYSSKEDVIYGGAYDYAGSYHHLIKRWVDPNTTIEKDIGAGTIGVTTDDNTGLVYITTYRDGGSIEVYDTSGWTTTTSSVDPNFTYDNDNDDGVVISNLAGLSVGPGFVPPFDPNITDDIDTCLSPCDGTITYTITLSQEWADEWIHHIKGFDKFRIVDELPDGLDFVEELNDPNWQYNAGSRTATWWIHDPNLWDWSDSISLTLELNYKATPGRPIKNVFNEVIVYSLHEDEIRMAEVETEVCNCADAECGEVIYVDFSAEGNDDGSTWTDAHTTLQRAISESWLCDQIWVAQGTYKATDIPTNTNATFKISNGVGIYGGFVGGASGEENRYERNWFDNETVLRGDIDSYDDEPNQVDYVVTSYGFTQLAWLDGFTIRGGSVAGIYCMEGSPTIQHNKITKNEVGIYCLDPEGPVIKNNWIYRNDYGVYFDSPADVAMVRNNTVVNNDEVGIYLSGGVEPEISNCIFTGQPKGYDLIGCDATYSYIDSPATGQGNIDGDPNYPPFVAGVDDYHLDPCSVCIDAGDPCANYGSERDIDKHFRVLDGDGDSEKRVDMGADEYCNQGTDNVADFNSDDIVETADLIEMASAWLIDDSDPCWAAKYDEYDLYDDDVIDYIDFAYFAGQWHWMTCEKMQGYAMIEMMMGTGGIDKMAGIMAETALFAPAVEQESSSIPAEPTEEEQIEQIELNLNWLDEIKDQIDEAIWLNLTGSLEEMLKELEGSY